MFTPIYLLPQYNGKDCDKYQSRWDTSQGIEIRNKVLKMIRDGAGEDFLQWDFEHKELGFLESMWDLKGIDIYNEKIDFPTDDNFEAIDFTYASFYHSKFRNATFPGTGFGFSKIYNCEFADCVFSRTSFYSATLEGSKFINCDFIEHNSITNCELREVKFERCFVYKNIFFNCKFDEQTFIDAPLDKPNIMKSFESSKSDLAEIFKGIKEGYMAGDVIRQARQYFFKERQSIIRYNAKGWRGKASGYFLELIAGYGIKPIRVLLTMLTIFLIFSIFFIGKVGISEGLLLSSGAFFTFGANTHLLSTLSGFWKIIYILESFLGISLMALFITVLANFWFREK
mgnify:CR=1 FL=1